MNSSTRKWHYVISQFAAIFIVACLVSCVGDGDTNTIQSVQPNHSQQANDQLTPIDTPFDPGAGYPPFPGSDAVVSVLRQTSDSESTLLGNEFSDEEGEGNGPGEADPDGYILAPGDNDELAYAIYGLGGFSSDRPEGFQIEADYVMAPGDNDPLPMAYWVGLSNYSSYSWEWSGPYSSPTSMELNSETLRERYVSKTDNFFYVVVTDSTGIVPSAENPQGISAVEVVSSTTSALDVSSPDYYPTVPHFPTDTSTGAGGSKGGSALDPATQYVTLNWTHVTDSASTENEASSYQVLRERFGGDGSITILNTVDASITTFTDPTDTKPALGEPVPGETYIYSVRAVNDSGITPFSFAGQQLIPFYAVAPLTASRGTFTDRIALQWGTGEGAVGYAIFRDNQENKIADIGDVDGWDDISVPDNVEHSYWIRPVNIYGTHGPLSATTIGRMNAAPVASIEHGDGMESGTEPHHVVFDASTSLDPDFVGGGNGITNYEWDFDGDGNYDFQATTPDSFFDYLVHGDYNATLRVTDTNGATAPAFVTIHVNGPPEAALTAEPNMGPSPLYVFLDARGSTDPDDGIADYEWDFDGNGVFNEEGNDEDLARGFPTASHTYNIGGYHEIRVRVTDEFGASDPAEALIEVI